MPHRSLNVPEHGMLDAYESQLKTRGYKSDPAQRAAVQRLQQLYTELVTFKGLAGPPCARCSPVRGCRAAFISGAGSGVARAS